MSCVACGGCWQHLQYLLFMMYCRLMLFVRMKLNIFEHRSPCFQVLSSELTVCLCPSSLFVWEKKEQIKRHLIRVLRYSGRQRSDVIQFTSHNDLFLKCNQSPTSTAASYFRKMKWALNVWSLLHLQTQQWLLYEAKSEETAATTADVEPRAGICCSHSNSNQVWLTEVLDVVTIIKLESVLTLFFTQQDKLIYCNIWH